MKKRKNISDVSYVCVDCGVKYLTEEQKKNSYATTFNIGKCCECAEETLVTNIRHYNYLRK